jgi:hypothetical protein
MGFSNRRGGIGQLSLSSFSRLSSSAEPKETRNEKRARKRRKKLAKELEDEESDLTLSLSLQGIIMTRRAAKSCVRILRLVYRVSYNFKLTVLERTTLQKTRHNSTLSGDEKEEGKTKDETSSFTFIPSAYCLLGNK